MIIPIQEIPSRKPFSRSACRLRVLEEFLASGYPLAEYTPEGDDTPRRAYNGLMMAIQRHFPGQLLLCWRHGRLYLSRIAKTEEK